MSGRHDEFEELYRRLSGLLPPQFDDLAVRLPVEPRYLSPSAPPATRAREFIELARQRGASGLEDLRRALDTIVGGGGLVDRVELSGAWKTAWRSVVNERRHDAILVIPPDHGQNFSAAMTIKYSHKGVPTVVNEVLAGTLVAKRLALVGQSCTWAQQGYARNYLLDRFNLVASDDCAILRGEAILTNGVREIVLRRVPGDGSGASSGS